MMDNTIRVLLIEPNSIEREQLLQMLSDIKDISLTVENTDSFYEGLKIISEKSIHVILINMSILDSTRLDLLAGKDSQKSAVLVILLTSIGEESLAAKMVQLGAATDYLPNNIKDKELLARTIRCAVERQSLLLNIKELTDTMQSGQKTLFYNMVETGPDPIVVVGEQGVVLFANISAHSLFGRSKDEFVGSSFGFPVTADKSEEIDIVGEDERIIIAEMRVTDILWE
ncbi:MAG: PAS domain-containing protein, partial [Planctomycetota bacterium]